MSRYVSAGGGGWELPGGTAARGRRSGRTLGGRKQGLGKTSPNVVRVTCVLLLGGFGSLGGCPPPPPAALRGV